MKLLFRFIAIATVMVAALLAGLTSSAAASDRQYLEVLGEDTGNNPTVNFWCKYGYIIGFQAQTGAWFDQLGPVCGDYYPDTRTLQPATDNPGMVGDPGGTYQSKQCPPNQAVEYIQFTMFEAEYKDFKTTNLDDLLFRCRPVTAASPNFSSDPILTMMSGDSLSVSGGNTATPELVGADVNGGFSHHQACPDGEFPVGMRIDAITAVGIDIAGVHRLGLVCSSKPFNGYGVPPASKTPTGPKATTSPSAGALGAGSAACTIANAAAQPFLGRWTVTSMPSGVTFPLTLNVDNCGHVAGGYTMSDGPGKISGGYVKNGVLSFNWTQGNFKGTGNFKLADTSLSGSWQFSGGPNGTWTAVPR